MIDAPSMGPFESHRRNIIRRYILNKVEIITLRDHISKAYLEDLKLTYPLVYLTADSAFQDSLDINKDHIKEIMIAEKIIDGQEDLTNKFLVGITPAGVDWNYRGSINPEEKQERYNRIIAKAIDYLIDKFNAKIVFFPQLYGNSDDVSLISEIIRLVQKKDAIRVLSKKWDSEVQQAIISQMDVVVGNRYHSVIFALKAEIPTVCIAYEHKSAGVMKAAKLDDFVININELTYELLTHKISQAWNQNEEIRRILKSNMPRIRRLSFANSVLAKALIRYAKSSDIRREELKKEVEQLMHDFSN
jgi:colanic acid/amylovoran biosynthesis protein